MTLSNEITEIHSDLEKHKKVRYVKVLLQEVRAKVFEVNSEIQTMVDDDSFDILDPDFLEFRTVLNNAWGICKTAQTGFENSQIAEVLDWVPEPEEPEEP